MKKKKRKKGKWRQWLVLGISMLVGVAMGSFLPALLEPYIVEMDSDFALLTLLAAVLIAMYAGCFLHVVIHELGHLVFGLRSGYGFSSFRIGNRMWLKEGDEIVRKKLSLAGTGGQCLMTPPELQNGKIPVVLYNLGGCIMNLIASAVFFAVYLLLHGSMILSPIFVILSLVGVLLALTNGIPLRVGAVDNDGRNALSLRKSPDAMRAFWLQLKINEQAARGTRLKDMPEEWFAVPADEAMKNSMVAAQGVFSANRLMDQQRFTEANQLMEHLLELDSGMVGLHRNLMICDRMYCELIRDNRTEVLTDMRTKEQNKFMKAMQKFPSVVRTEYTYALLALKNQKKADAARRLFEKVTKTYPYTGDIQSERDLIAIADRLKAVGSGETTAIEN